MHLKIIPFLAVASLFLSSCAIKKEAYQATDEIALISLSANEEIKNTTSLQALMVSDLRGLDTISDGTAEMLHQQFFKLTPKLTGKLMDEEAVLNTKKFEDYVATLKQELNDLEKIAFAGVEFHTPDDYPFVRPMRKKPMMRAFRYLPAGADAVLVVNAYFSLEEGGSVNVGGISSAGFMKQKVRCRLWFSMYNEAGKAVINYQVSKLSENKIGNKSPDGTLDKLVEEALTKAMTTANEKFMKKL